MFFRYPMFATFDVFKTVYSDEHVTNYTGFPKTNAYMTLITYATVSLHLLLIDADSIYVIFGDCPNDVLV